MISNLFHAVVVFLTIFVMGSFSPSANTTVKKVNGQTTSVKVGWYQSDNFQEGMSDTEAKSGYCYEYLQKIGDYNGWSYQYEYGEWSGLLSQLESGEIDVMAGVSDTPERELTMSFPNNYMGTENYYLYQHTTDKVFSVEDLTTFNGKAIGAIKDNLMTTYLEEWVVDNKIPYVSYEYDTQAIDENQLNIIYFDGFDLRDEQFNQGKLDGIVSTDNNIPVESGYSPVVKVGQEPYYLAVAKNRGDLLSELNSALGQIQEMEPYFLQNLQYSYFGKTATNSILSEPESDWVKNHSVLKMGYLDNYLPYCKKDNNGNVYGLITDVMNESLKDLSLASQVSIEYYCYSNYDEMLSAVKDGSVDAAFPVGGSVWNIEQDGINATSAVVSAGMNLVYQGTYSSESTKKIAVNKNNKLQYYYTINNFPDAEVVNTYNTIEECLDAVKKGEVGSTILNGLRTDIVSDNSTYKSLSVLQLQTSDDRRIGVNNTNTALLLLLNRGLNLIGQGYGVNASYKYINEFYEYTFKNFLQDNFMWVLTVLIVIFGIIIAIFIYYSKRINKAKKETLQQLLANEKLTKEKEKELKVVEALSDSFSNVFLIHQEDKTVEVVKMRGWITTILNSSDDGLYSYQNIIDEFIKSNLIQEDKSITQDFLDWDHMIQGSHSDNYERNFHILKEDGVHQYQIRFRAIANSKWIICGFQNIDALVADNEKRQKELQEALDLAEEASNAKTSFLFNMSHDIRTPMNAIMGFTELLDKHQEEPERRKEYLQKIEDASTVLLSIINNVLEMARIEKGALTLQETIWNTEHLNETLISVFLELMKQKEITFTQSCEITHHYVYCDATKVREIFLNILSNAYKYTNKGGKVTVTTKELPCDKEGYLLYQTAISDNGIGMSKEYLPHIFEEFSRENNTTESKIQGTGLGMPIVKRLVDFLGGTIVVESEKGVGSTFTVTLPFRIAEEIASNEDVSENINPNRFKGKRILLAEDNELNAEIANEILTEAGFLVDRVENGSLCVDKLSNSKDGDYDLILMDIQMPVMNGYEATKVIRSLKDGFKSRIPIIAMTANAFQEDKQAALEAGMNGHIAKPIDLKELFQTIAKFL